MSNKDWKFETEYKGDDTLEEVIGIYRQGCSDVEVCNALEISKKTFKAWYKEHEDFKEAVDKGRQLAEGSFMYDGRKGFFLGNKFNAVVWQMYGRKFFGFSEHRHLRIEDWDINASYADKAKRIEEATVMGDVTPAEGELMQRQIYSAAKVEEMVELKERIKVLEEKLNNV